MTSVILAPRGRSKPTSVGASSWSSTCEPVADGTPSSSLATNDFVDSIDRVTEGSRVSCPSRSTSSPTSRSLSDVVGITSSYYKEPMDEASFDRIAHAELRHLEDAFADVDPDEVEVSV